MSCSFVGKYGKIGGGKLIQNLDELFGGYCGITRKTGVFFEVLAVLNLLDFVGWSDRSVVGLYTQNCLGKTGCPHISWTTKST